MLTWDDEVELSQKERRRVRELATSGLDRVLVQLSRTRAMLEAMPRPDLNRDALLARVCAEQVRVAALRRERLAQVAKRLPESGRLISVPWGWLEKYLCSKPTHDEVIRRDGRVVAFESASGEAAGWVKQLQRTYALLSIRRGGELLKSLRTRTLAKRRARCGAVGLAGRVPSILSRSAASRSRMVAPIGAPPSIS
jgi:hypothetical protein